MDKTQNVKVVGDLIEYKLVPKVQTITLEEIDAKITALEEIIVMQTQPLQDEIEMLKELKAKEKL